MKTDTDTKDPDRFNAQQNTDNNRNIQYEKRNGKALLAPTGWICLELVDLLLVQTGIKYPDLTEIGKGAVINTRKASHIAWKSKTVYIFLGRPHNQIPLCMKLQNVWR